MYISSYQKMWSELAKVADTDRVLELRPERVHRFTVNRHFAFYAGRYNHIPRVVQLRQHHPFQSEVFRRSARFSEGNDRELF